MYIKIQKILMFIPMINIFTVHCWIFLALKKRARISRCLKKIFIMLGLVILVTIPRFLAQALCDNDIVVNIVNHASLYATPFVMAYVAVKDQEKILEENGEK